MSLESQYPNRVAQQPQPDPALKKFEPWVGKWSYRGEWAENPFGPAGEFAGELRREMGGYTFSCVRRIRRVR
jgi:hypothetical protein